MKSNYPIRPLHFSALVLSTTLLTQAYPVLAQITPDNTLGAESSTVTTRDENSDSIQGGAVRGQNLFHSFEDFNVGENRGVYFANPDAVDNIFSRVTGDNVSNILGTLGVDGAADLYLVNPNGIVFGENSSLDVQGSFTATTAEGIEFGEGGLFSAVTPGESLLTISVPLGLQFGSTPGSIINRSFVQDETGEFVGLQVPDGKNLTLVGGDILFEAGEATARGGNIYFGGLAEAGTVEFNNDASLSFPDNLAKADLSFLNAADVDVRGTGGGNINLDAGNLNIEAGESGYSQVRAGITADSTSTEAQAGNIAINATGDFAIIGSLVLNEVNSEAVGNAGNINIKAKNISLDSGSIISSGTFGQGNPGSIFIIADNAITLNKTSYIANNVQSNDAVGNAGKIEITTGSLSATNGSQINSFTRGRGNAGNITIQAADAITFNGVDDDNNYSGVSSTVEAGGVGDGGNIDITANSLSLTNGGEIDVRVREALDSLPSGKGRGGNIDIQAGNLIVKEGGLISSSTFGFGDSGNISIKVDNAISLDTSSYIFNNVDMGAVGKAGQIDITTGSLLVTNGSQINSLIRGKGNGGDITIRANSGIIFDGVDDDDNYSGVFNAVDAGGKGDAGDITITANELDLTNGGKLNARVDAASDSLPSGEGQGGDININVNDTLTISEGNTPGIVASLGTGAKGKGGNIDIQAGNLVVKEGGQIDASTFGFGDSGSISIAVDNTISLDGSDIFTVSIGLANGGNIFLDAKNIFIDAGTIASSSVDLVEFLRVFSDSIDLTSILSFLDFDPSEGISVNEFINNLVNENSDNNIEQGNSGNVTIKASESVNIINRNSENTAAVITSSTGNANSGNISISSPKFSLSKGIVTTGTAGTGNSGNIDIDNTETIEIVDSTLSANTSINSSGNGGNLSISTQNLFVKESGFISTSTRGTGDAGNITINASQAITINGASNNNFSSRITSDIEEEAKGNAGIIDIKTSALKMTNGGIIGTGAFGEGDAGEIIIDTNFVVLEKKSIISSRSRTIGNAGNITLNTLDLLTLQDSFINSNSDFSAGGRIDITAGKIQLLGDSDIRTEVSSGADNGGDIVLKADSIIAFDDSDIFAFAADGKGGNINLDTPVFFAENFTLNSLTEDPDNLDLNDRADLNATGAVSGAVEIPDVSFIQNGLTELTDNSIDTNELVANSCVVPAGERSQGKFIITGRESLPIRPGNNLPSRFSTGEVRGAEENNTSSWQPGDPIVEPQGVYRLANGKLVLSRECNYSRSD